MRNRLSSFLLLILGLLAQHAAYGRVWFDKTNAKTAGYALIVVGNDHNSDGSDFKSDAYRWYQYYANVKGFDKSHIYVLYGNGNAMALEDYGPNVVNGAATATNVRTYLSKISQNCKSTDEFVLTIASHGAFDHIDTEVSRDNIVNATEVRNNFPTNYKNATFMMNSCQGGSWIDEIKADRNGNKRKNLTIITATSANRSAYKNSNGSTFFNHFYKALGYKGETKVDCDYNKDGVISFEEAFVYAKDNDSHSSPSNSNGEQYSMPRYWNSNTDWRFCRTEDWGVIVQDDKLMGSNITKEAMYLLVGKCVIASGSNVTFNSGKMIKLQKGFRVVKGAKFRTSHFDCEDEKRQNEAELRSGAIAEAEMEEEQDVINYVFYPNPSSTGLFNINLGETPATITVYDSYGKCVEVLNNVDGNVVVDLSGRAKGIYAANIETEKKNVVCRLIVR